MTTTFRPIAFVTIAVAAVSALAGCGRQTEQGGSQSTSTATTQGRDAANTGTLGTPGADSQNAGAQSGVSGTNAGGSTTGVPGVGVTPAPAQDNANANANATGSAAPASAASAAGQS
jgi:hypothetical protein